MKINLQPICVGLELSEYDARMAPGVVFVWVNPTRAFLARRDEIMREFSVKRPVTARTPIEVSPVSEENEDEAFAPDQAVVAAEAKQEGAAIRERLETFNLQMCAWYAELWSQGVAVETHWTAEEVQRLGEVDPALFAWLVDGSARKMKEHRTVEKKS